MAQNLQWAAKNMIEIRDDEEEDGIIDDEEYDVDEDPLCAQRKSILGQAPERRS